MMKMPLGDIQRGALGQAPFEIAQQRIAPDICYEDVFGEEIIRSVRAQPGSPGATMLINISNLGWFGDTWALRQHLQISRMRALETARSEEHTSELQSRGHLVCRLLLEKKN